MALEQQNGRVRYKIGQESGFCGTKLRGDETLSPIIGYNRRNFGI